MKTKLFGTGVQLLGTVLLLLVVSNFSTAQSSATISGFVSDEQEAKVNGAEVTLYSKTGLERRVKTDSNGAYAFTGLKNGDYIVEARAEGFSVVSTGRINVSGGQRVEKMLTMTVGAISENVQVTASGIAQTPEEVAKSVTTIEASEIENKGSESIAEALRGTPGLRVQQQGSPGALVTLRFRGQRNFDTSVLLDGLRVRDASDINGSAAPLYSDILPANLDRIEILRGSGSSIYGTNAIGGVINLVPKTGEGKPRFEAGFEAGNLGLFREKLGGSGGLGSRAGYSFNLTRIDYRKGIDGHDQYGDTTTAGRIQFNPTPTILIAGNFLGSFANARVNDSPFALPGAFTTSESFPGAVEGQTFHADFNNPDEGRRTNFWVGSVRFTQAVNNTVSYSAAYQHVTTHRRNYNGSAIDPTFATLYPFGDFEFVSVNNGSTDTLDARSTVQAGRFNLLTGGVEFEQESFYQESIPSFSSFNKTTDRQRTYAVFGQDQISLLEGRLQVLVAVRAQSFRVRAADRPGALAGVNAEGSVVGDGAVSYFAARTGTKFRAHVGNGFRAPSLFERFGAGTFSGAGFVRFGDPTVRAEQSISVDGGIDQRLAGDRLRFGLTYFYTHLQRTIIFTGFTTDPLGLGRFSGYANGPGGLSRGVESNIEFHPVRGMNLMGSYTFTNSDRNVAGVGLLPEFVIPRHLFSVSFSQSFGRLQFSAEVNRTGSYIAPVFENDFPFRRANLKFDGYTKVDIFGSYRYPIGERVEAVFFAGAENLFNQRYFENGFRAPGIMGKGGLKLEF